MSVCPVCQDVLDMDAGAFEHHVNSHFEAPPYTPHAVPLVQRPDECPLCGYPLHGLDANEVAAHTNTCLDEHPRSRDESIGGPDSWAEGAMQNMAQGDTDNAVEDGWEGPAKPGDWFGWVSKKPRKGDRWWDPLDTKMDPYEIPVTYSPHAVAALRTLLKDPAYPATHHSVLSKDTTHIRHSFVFDLGWGCGYRNALMIISSLILNSPAYRQVFSRERHGSDPGVRRVQGWIEEAWRAGYDVEGCQQLSGKLLGTRKWIGVTELYAMFSYLGVESTIYDFPKPKGGGNPASRNLVNWVRTYFDEGVVKGSAEWSRIVAQSSKLPLILQHSGHSRTIVGYEETRQGINFLLLDPGIKLPKDIRALGIQHLERSRPSSTSLPRRTASNQSSHESLGFQRPYTTGAADPVIVAEPESESAIQLEDDEEMTKGGWVRRRVSKVVKRRKTGDSALSNGSGEIRARSAGEMLGFFRVNESRLAKYKEYQILAFTGGPILSEQEKERRKTIASVLVQ